MTLVELPFSLTRRPLDLSALFADDPHGPRVEDALCIRDLRNELEMLTEAFRRVPHGTDRSARAERRKLLHALAQHDYARALLRAEPTSHDHPELKEIRHLVSTLRRAESRLHDVYLAAHERKAKLLKEALSVNADLRWAIRSLGPDVERSLSRVVNHRGAPDKRYRKHELVFTRIASRAGTKTSPLSRFNMVDIRASDETLEFELLDTSFSFHNSALFELLEAIALSDDGIDLFEWKVRPYTGVVDGAIVAYIEGWNGDKASVYRTKEGAIRVPASPTLTGIVASESPWSVARIAKTFEMQVPHARVLVRRLADSGIFQLSHLPSDRRDLASAIAMTLQHLLTDAPDDHPAVAECARQLQMLSNELTEVNRNPTSDSLDSVSTGLLELRGRWGARGKRDAGGLVYEDYVKRGAIADPLVGTALTDLASLLALWPLFDVNLRVQLTFNAAVADRHGEPMRAADADFFRMAAAASTKYRDFWTAPWREIPSDVHEVHLLDDLRRQFVQSMTSLGSEEHVRLEPETVKKLLNEIPQEIAALSASYSILYMERGSDIVVNRIYPGHQAFLGRFLRHSSIPARYQELLSDFYSGEDHVVADIYETYGFNATARPHPPVPRRVVSVYTRDRDADTDYERVIDLHTAEVDTSNTRVRIRTVEGELVQPIITSNLIRTFYPAYTAFTGSLYGNVNHLMELSAVFLGRLSLDQVTTTPRVSYGRLVIERMRWFVPTSFLDRDRQSTHHERFVYLACLLADLGIPMRFYFHLRLRQFDGDRVWSVSREFGKPQYFDINNPLLINVLMNAISGSNWIMIVEAMPDQPGTPEHVREFMVHGKTAA